MPSHTRSERIKIGDTEHWKGVVVEHVIGERRMSKKGSFLTLLEQVGIYSIPNRSTYLVADDKGNKLTVNPEAWDMMKEV